MVQMIAVTREPSVGAGLTPGASNTILTMVCWFVGVCTGSALLISLMAGTQVLAGDPNDPTAMISRNIEDIQVGDLVWTRPQDNPDAPLELRPVTSVERHVVYDLRRLSVQELDGYGQPENTEELSVTPEHPFYSMTRGTWVGAGSLAVGEQIVSADGRVLTVSANLSELHPEGLAVYNFTVDGDHTYFVADGKGEESWVWVHNTCAGFNHFVTRALGSPIARGSKKVLTWLNSALHTDFHLALNAFLRTKTKEVAGKLFDMMARKGQKGEIVREVFTAEERIAALKEFFKHYDGGSWEASFLYELGEVIRKGGLL